MEAEAFRRTHYIDWYYNRLSGGFDGWAYLSIIIEHTCKALATIKTPKALELKSEIEHT